MKEWISKCGNKMRLTLFFYRQYVTSVASHLDNLFTQYTLFFFKQLSHTVWQLIVQTSESIFQLGKEKQEQKFPFFGTRGDVKV